MDELEVDANDEFQDDEGLYTTFIKYLCITEQSVQVARFAIPLK